MIIHKILYLVIAVQRELSDFILILLPSDFTLRLPKNGSLFKE